MKLIWSDGGANSESQLWKASVLTSGPRIESKIPKNNIKHINYINKRAKRNENTGEWRKSHNAELHTLYSSPNIIRSLKSRRLRWAGHVARMEQSRNAYRVLVGKPEGKRPLRRSRCRWEDNIKMDLSEVGLMLETGWILLNTGSRSNRGLMKGR